MVHDGDYLVWENLQERTTGGADQVFGRLQILGTFQLLGDADHLGELQDPQWSGGVCHSL